MGLRRHDVGSESVARMSQGQVVAGLSSIPPSSPPPKDGLLFRGLAAGSGACLLLILAVLTSTHLVVFTTSPDVRWVPAVDYLLTQQ